MEPATSLSTIFHQLSDHPMKRFLASHAVSDFIRMLSALIKKLMASDVVVYVVEWFNEQNVTALVAVAVIGLLMIYCCYKCLKNGCVSKSEDKTGTGNGGIEEALDVLVE
ncbi:hypothetical protein OIU84_017065 [Salix udensis]|uniref:Uncharacterized protein n=1 Tax=Salix udensis TaxID=889485 RepID=A0AAD6L163_9ROSI|nr:hypothetical protein OIU84_017065 [Salix udensis]